MQQSCARPLRQDRGTRWTMTVRVPMSRACRSFVLDESPEAEFETQEDAVDPEAVGDLAGLDRACVRPREKSNASSP
jgi:hypothetical protein